MAETTGSPGPEQVWHVRLAELDSASRRLPDERQHAARGWTVLKDHNHKIASAVRDEASSTSSGPTPSCRSPKRRWHRRRHRGTRRQPAGSRRHHRSCQDRRCTSRRSVHGCTHRTTTSQGSSRGRDQQSAVAGRGRRSDSVRLEPLRARRTRPWSARACACALRRGPLPGLLLFTVRLVVGGVGSLLALGISGSLGLHVLARR